MMQPVSVRRRSLLQGALAAGAWGLLPLRALAQVPAAAAGTVLGAALGAPRRALVIGNDRYRDSPLKNPVNDARAITAELEAADFSVTVSYDATLADMQKRIDAFAAELARTKAVGLFYFAGHGIQLSWRNYLLPVDTVVNTRDEVQHKAVDLARLLEGIGRAGNPANIVILDACRNNPFGRDFRIEQKGLSQVDAPVGTLLAYATAPGNVAIDGEGDNGLYTSHLLREIRVPDAKVEDIFKRVRLAVRRESRGLQVPWESTSLEDDFYFQLPEELRQAADAARRQRTEAELVARRAEEERLRRIEAEILAKANADAEQRRKAEEERQALLRAEEERRRLANAEREARERAEAQNRQKLERQRIAKARDETERARLYEEQRSAWEGLAETQDIAALEAFIYRYPNGQFSEVAQLRLDRLLAARGEKRVEVVNAPDNPYTKGSARADTNFRVGDVYVYLLTDKGKSEQRKMKDVVTEVTDTEVIINNGNLVLDLLGNAVRIPSGRRFIGRQDFAVEYAIGKRWSTRVKTSMGDVEGEIESEFRVVARERITVPAGSFDCFKVEGRGEGLSTGGGRGLRGGMSQLQGEQTYWIAPGQVRRPILWEQQRRVAPGGRSPFIAQWERLELLYFKQG